MRINEIIYRLWHTIIRLCLSIYMHDQFLETKVTLHSDFSSYRKTRRHIRLTPSVFVPETLNGTSFERRWQQTAALQTGSRSVEEKERNHGGATRLFEQTNKQIEKKKKGKKGKEERDEESNRS